MQCGCSVKWEPRPGESGVPGGAGVSLGLTLHCWHHTRAQLSELHPTEKQGHPRVARRHGQHGLGMESPRHDGKGCFCPTSVTSEGDQSVIAISGHLPSLASHGEGPSKPVNRLS